MVESLSGNSTMRWQCRVGQAKPRFPHFADVSDGLPSDMRSLRMVDRALKEGSKYPFVEK